MPAIVDHTPLERGAPISVFESGAILLYLADKSEQFIANDLRGRVEVLQWLFWQVGGLARWRDRTIISQDMRRKKFRTPSSATSRKQIACTEY